jgi:CubicO group peptidase (beta-lactamase class C family)
MRNILKMVKPRIRLLLFAILTFAAIAGKITAQNPGKVWMKYSSPEEAGFSSEKLKAVYDLYEKNKASAIMVVYNGNVLLWKGDITRRYDIHSMRKSLVSALYGIYEAKGKIKIDKTLKQLGIDDNEKLTELEKTATIQDLLKARSGIYIGAFGETKSMEKDRPKRGSHAPNTFFYYNNWDFNVLGQIFQQETNQNLFDAFEKSIAKPLQMEDYRLIDGRFWSDSTRKTKFPKYDIKMSARDLARFGVLYCDDGYWNKKRIIKNQWIWDTFTPYSYIDHKTYKEAYGYLWWIEMIDDTIPMYSALGAGGHVLSVVPKYHLVMVKRHDTFGDGAGDTWGGMYIRKILAARVSKPAKKPKLVPLGVEEEQIVSINMPKEQLKKYEQKIKLNGRMRKIEYTAKYGLLYDDWFVMKPISKNKFYLEDYNRCMYFKFIYGKPVFEKIE